MKLVFSKNDLLFYFHRSGMWDFLFSADFLVFENFLGQNISFFSFIFSLFLAFLPNFTLFFYVFVSGLSHPW